MKRIPKLCIALLLLGASARASNPIVDQIIASDLLQSRLVVAADLIDWKVGEYQKYNLSASLFTGLVDKSVASEEGDSIWLQSDMTINIFGQEQKQKVEALIRRNDGKLMKLIVNGEEQRLPANDPEIEILEQRQESVTVPAGTFDAIYVKVKTVSDGQEQIQEVWLNPRDVNMDGVIKVIAEAQGIEMTLELTKFGISR